MINFTQFATNMKTWIDAHGGGVENFTAAQFGMEMIEGVQKVRFVLDE